MANKSFISWADQHHPKWLDGLRVLLGIILLIKGISFIIHKEVVMQVFMENDISFIPWMLIHYVIVFQITNGALIAIGLVTRIACAVQIPTVVGALLVIWMRPEFSMYSSDVMLAVLVTFLLGLFFFYGAGPYSVDALLKKKRAENSVESFNGI